ncbi:MAG: hypothetical protein AAFU86_04735 [Pseudomonadota bacterium]
MGFARAPARLDHLLADVNRANAFRDVALRLATAAPDEIDRYVTEQRPLMVSMLDALIYNRSHTSRDVFERLIETCKTFGAQHAETRDLI